MDCSAVYLSPTAPSANGKKQEDKGLIISSVSMFCLVFLSSFVMQNDWISGGVRLHDVRAGMLK